MFRICIFLLFGTHLFSQQSYFVVDDIHFIGNRKTKERIILRELEFEKGDTLQISEAPKLIKSSEENLFRTKLFFEVGINWKVVDNKNIMVITLAEAWYLYPVPTFELADRNFNIWWSEMGASLNRVNFGVRLDHLNLTGNRDKLKLKSQFGYTYKYEMEYNVPIINKKETWGTTFNILWSRQKEIGYITRFNKVQFFGEDDFLYNRFRVSTLWTYRPRYLQSHSFKLEFNSNNIGDTVMNGYNTEFYHEGRQELQWFVLEYEWDYNKLNHFNYPTSGSKASINIKKEGLGLTNDVDLLSVSATLEKYYDFNTKRWSIGMRAKGRKVITNGNPGYYHYRALGYGGDQLRGYELFVIDGLNYGYVKSAINFQFFRHKRRLGKWMFLKEFRHFSIQSFLALSLDAGYVQSPYFNEDNPLNNTYLIGGGPALHILLYNYFLMRIEYSYNRQGEKGVFLHFKASF